MASLSWTSTVAVSKWWIGRSSVDEKEQIYIEVGRDKTNCWRIKWPFLLEFTALPIPRWRWAKKEGFTRTLFKKTDLRIFWAKKLSNGIFVFNGWVWGKSFANIFSEKRNDLILPSTETLIVFQAAQGVRPKMTGRVGAFRKSCRWLPYCRMLPVEVCWKVQLPYMKSNIFTLSFSQQLQTLSSQECYNGRFLFVIVLQVSTDNTGFMLKKSRETLSTLYETAIVTVIID